MKRIAILLISALIPCISFAQAQITTKKVKIEDFTEKTTRVVMSGNLFFDQALKEEVKSRWRISPFEFCTLEEFEQTKTDPDLYFLMLVKGQFRKESEPGLYYLSVVKGGEDAAKSIDRMLDVVTVPIMSVQNPNGREFVFLPAILDILQEHILLSMERDVNAYTGLSNYTINIRKADKMKIVLAEDDLAPEITDKVRKLYKDMSYTDTDTADEIFIDNTPETLVSFTVSPTDAKNGSYCYKMLIDASTHKLYYFRKHKISSRAGAGFLVEDINRIATR